MLHAIFGNSIDFILFFAVENQQLAVRAGAIDALLVALRAHVGNAGVSEQACHAIGNLCVDNGAAPAHTRCDSLVACSLLR